MRCSAHTYMSVCMCIFVRVRTWYVPIRPGNMHMSTCKCWTIHMVYLQPNLGSECTVIAVVSRVKICSSLPAYRIQPQQSSIPEDKCMVVTIVLVDSLGLIPFFLAYHLLFAIDYPKLKILALLWEIMNLIRVYGIKSLIAGSRTNCYLHNQILNWCFFLKVAV